MTSVNPPPESTAPPVWAQGLLTWLVPLASEESIPGRLLEEYREVERPSRGQWRADLWYLRQVGGLLCRVAWMFAIFNAAAVILRTILDTFAPPGSGPHAYQMRSSASTYSAVGIFLLAGIYAGYRTGRARGGVLAAATEWRASELSCSTPSFATIPPSSTSSTSPAVGTKPSGYPSSSRSLPRGWGYWAACAGSI